MNGVIEDSTGYLIRAGYSSFTANAGETVRTDVPEPPHVKYRHATHWHKWNGSSWEDEDVSSTKKVKLRAYAPKGVVHPDYLPLIGLDFKRGLTQYLHDVRPLSPGDQGLTPVRTFYSTFIKSTGVYSDPIIKLASTYTDNETEDWFEEDCTISWYLDDGTLHPTTKSVVKIWYSGERQAVLEKRRGRIIRFLEGKSLVHMLDTMDASPWSLTDAQIKTEHAKFWTDYNDLIGGYVAAYNLAINTDPTDGWNSKIYNETGVNAGNSWLDNTIPGSSPPQTIRQLMTSEVDYG